MTRDEGKGRKGVETGGWFFERWGEIGGSRRRFTYAHANQFIDLITPFNFTPAAPRLLLSNK